MLADDDIDDCEYFKDALDEINYNVDLTVVNDGVQLMNTLLAPKDFRPDLLFLDLNMPKKSGIECLEEIKSTKELNGIPIIIFTTSSDRTVINRMYENGAHHYIQKPNQFSGLKKVIEKAIKLFNNGIKSPSMDRFIIHP